jgi:hypothetical protein
LRDHPAAGESHAVDRRDRRLAQLDVVAGDRKHVPRWNREPALRHLLQVATRAEGLVARTGQDGDAQRGIAFEAVPCGEQTFADLFAQSIARLRAIQSDDRDAIVARIEQYSVAH